MKNLSALILMFASIPAFASEKLKTLSGEYTAFFGHAKKQQYIPDVQITGCDAPGIICTGVFYRWTLVIEEHISGKTLPKKFKAVMYQHGEFPYAYKQSAMYVVRKITDPKNLGLFGADYYIEEYSPPRKIYCLERKDEKYGISGDAIAFLSFVPGCYVRDGEI